MATVDDVAALALELPGVVEGERHGNRDWSVGGKGFAWVRPFSKADLRRLGEAVPAGPIVAVRLEDLHEKEAVLAADHAGIFTIEHFNGYPAVLIHLSVVRRKALRDTIVDGWLACASPDVATEYLAGRRRRRAP